MSDKYDSILAPIKSEPNKTVLDTFKAFLEDEDETEMYVSGPGGTGKTEQLAHMVRYCLDNDITYLVGAYTHKACDVLKKRIFAEGYALAPVKTIWSFLKKSPGVNENATNIKHVTVSNKRGEPEIVRVIFFDEYSMISEQDYFDIGSIQTDDDGKVVTKLVYLGDKMQLPPVGSARAIYPRGKYQVELTHNYRADDCLQPVLTTLRQMKETGKIIRLPKVPCVHRGAEIVAEYCVKAIDRREFSCLMVAYTNAKTDTLNMLVHEKMTGRQSIQAGDKVILDFNKTMYKYKPFTPDLAEEFDFDTRDKYKGGILKNDNKSVLTESNDKYGSLNILEQLIADLPIELLQLQGRQHAVLKPAIYGYAKFNEIKKQLSEEAVKHNNLIKDRYKCQTVTEFCRENRNLQEVRARNYAWRMYMTFNELVTAFSLPYASTVHKAQGSTYDYVFIDGADMLTLYKYNAMEYVSLFYTAVSRARYEVYINN